MTAAKPTTEQALLEVLASRPDITVAEIADATGLGRSTVGKALAKLEDGGKVRRSAGGREGARRLPDRWSLVTAEADAEPPADAPRPAAQRLRPGQLDGLVLDYLRERDQDGGLGPTAVAKGLGRSSGAVANCLARLAAAGRVRQVSERPRRYAARRPIVRGSQRSDR